MRRIKGLPRLIIFAVLCALLFSPTLPGRAQQPQTITAEGTITSVDGISIPFTMEFSPTGGPVTGTIDFTSEVPWYGVVGGTCPDTMKLTMNGTFAGGDGGAANGDLLGDEKIRCGEYLDGGSGGGFWIIYGPDSNLSAYGKTDWTGNFYANGTGRGVLHFWYRVIDFTKDRDYRNGPTEATWQVTFSAAEFQAALPNQITSEYIYTKYGIRVEDSFGGDGWDQKSWSDHELGLLNDVLKELPPGFLNQISLTRIVRNKVYIDAHGNSRLGTRGVYSPCKIETDPDCTGSLTTIRIFDAATTVLTDFPNDPDQQFKATILHEITHAYQAYKDGNSIYKDLNDSPQSQNYRDATRSKRGENDTPYHNGWAWYDPPGKYENWNYEANNQPPTQYAMTSPLEDMSDSVKMYFYNPSLLKNKSMDRYNYIRDYMFGGVEYDNGIQKKP